MPNTKSAERRMRSSARKQAHNRSIKSRLHTLERKYAELLGAGKKDEAAKSGVIHRSTADRKKSRLTLRLGRAA